LPPFFSLLVATAKKWKLPYGSDILNCCVHDKCVSYRGQQSQTVYGATCIPWNELPTSNEWHPDKWPNSGLVSNYCRNPGGLWRTAWCFVRTRYDKETALTDGYRYRAHPESCALPNCTATEAETCCDGNCASYRGKLNITMSGARCVPWSDLGAKETYHPGKHPRAGLELNYCRNPDENHPVAWCFTKIKGIKKPKWENCALPYCSAKDTENCCEEDDCTTYRAKLSTTRTGKKCASWRHIKKGSPYHPQNPYSQNYGLQRNYCRNPSNNAKGAWCYTNEKKDWSGNIETIDTFEFCSLPQCSTVMKNGCTLYDWKTGQPDEKWDHVYCGSGPGDTRRYHGCGTKENKYKGKCWMQISPGQGYWCLSGQNLENTECNPNMSPVDAGKYCYERAAECTDKDALNKKWRKGYEKLVNDWTGTLWMPHSRK